MESDFSDLRGRFEVKVHQQEVSAMLLTLELRESVIAAGSVGRAARPTCARG